MLKEDFSTPGGIWNSMGFEPLHVEAQTYADKRGAEIDTTNSGNSWCTSQQSHCNSMGSHCQSMGSHCNSRASWCNPRIDPPSP